MNEATKGTVATLKAALIQALAPILDRGREVALLDFPAYSNVGDSAIWLGELSLLRHYRQTIRYTCDINTYSSKSLSVSVGDGVILLSGGGNFGDLWPRHQQFREHVVGAFPKHKIVQLPQSIHFQDASSLRRASQSFRAHKDITIMVRDEHSMEIATRYLADNVILCPDAAFAIDILPAHGALRNAVLWLGRSDIESAALNDPENLGLSRYDWPAHVSSPWIRLGDYVRRQRGLRPRLEPISNPILHRLYERMAWARLTAGCRLLGRGRVVITDRLHGHILCLLLGIEHVLLDNSYGKLSRFHARWTNTSTITHWSSSWVEAKRIADGLLAKQASAEGGA